MAGVKGDESRIGSGFLQVRVDSPCCVIADVLSAATCDPSDLVDPISRFAVCDAVDLGDIAGLSVEEAGSTGVVGEGTVRMRPGPSRQGGAAGDPVRMGVGEARNEVGAGREAIEAELLVVSRSVAREPLDLGQELAVEVVVEELVGWDVGREDQERVDLQVAIDVGEGAVDHSVGVAAQAVDEDDGEDLGVVVLAFDNDVFGHGQTSC